MLRASDPPRGGRLFGTLERLNSGSISASPVELIPGPVARKDFGGGRHLGSAAGVVSVSAALPPVPLPFSSPVQSEPKIKTKQKTKRPESGQSVCIRGH